MQTPSQNSSPPRPKARGRECAATRDVAENRLFDACCDMLEAAQELEQRASDPASAGAVTASIGCLSATLERLAYSAGSMRLVVISSELVQPSSRRKVLAQRLENARASLRRAAFACRPEVTPEASRPRCRVGAKRL